MFGVLISACLIPAVLSIIVTDPPPTSTEYNYSYNVLDPHTGDTKSLHEVRRGDVVTGSYSVIDPDGTHRVVEYTADSRRGFKAIVHSEPLAIPYHHVLRDRHYIPRGNTRYLNQYYTSHTLYRDHPVSVPLRTSVVPKRVPVTHNTYTLKRPTSNRQKTKTVTDSKQTRYFTPANDLKTNTLIFKQGEYFAPNN